MIILIIGLTGSTGSGKSAVADYLNKINMFIIDADKIGHEIIKKEKPAYTEVVQTFGDLILDSNKEINRQKLGNIVFQDQNMLKLLNEYTHKYIIDEIKALIKTQITKEYRGIVIDAALLIESGLNKLADKVWIVSATRDIRLKRIMERDNLTYEQALARINSQTQVETLYPYADEIIHNDKDFETTIIQVNQILKKEKI